MPRRKPQRIVAVGSLPNRDPHDLMRFVRAQNAPAGPDLVSVYDTALRGILHDGKSPADDWLDCVLPRLRSRGGGKRDPLSLRSKEEACAFMEMPVLGNRLLEVCEAMLLRSRVACPVTLLGSRENAAKARSSLVLFAGLSERAAVPLQKLLSGLFSSVQAGAAETGEDNAAEIGEGDDPEGRTRPPRHATAPAEESAVAPRRKKRAEGDDNGGAASKRHKPCSKKAMY